MMTDVLYALMAAAAGFVLGALYFSGLWWTVQRLTRAKRPVVLVMGSFFIRILVCGAGFAALAYFGRGWMLIPALIGFILSRTYLVRVKGYSRFLEEGKKG